MTQSNSLPGSLRAWSDSTTLIKDKSAATGLQSLEKVDASTLPAKVLVLLSKYAKALKDHNGIVIQLSSLNVFRNVHHTSLLCDDARVQKLHRQLLVHVRSHIQLGSMYLIGQKPDQKKTKFQKPIRDREQQVSLDFLVRQSPYNRASNNRASNSNNQNFKTDGIEPSMSVLN